MHDPKVNTEIGDVSSPEAKKVVMAKGEARREGRA